MGFSIIAAVDKNFGIGKNNTLPWRLKGDLKYFHELTTEKSAKMNSSGHGSPLQYEKFNAVIMGRKTWESLPEKHRPLKGRLNVVLSRGGLRSSIMNEPKIEDLAVTDNFGENSLALGAGGDDLTRSFWCDSLDTALEKLGLNKKVDQVFVIGGASIFAQAIIHPQCQRIYLTEVFGQFDCDTFFPPIPADFRPKGISHLMEENGISYRFVVYERS